MTSFDPTKTFDQLLGETEGDEIPQPQQAPESGSLSELLDRLESEPPASELDAAAGEFNKTLSLSSGKLSQFSNPPTALEIASSEEPPPFSPPLKLKSEISLNELLDRVEQGTADDLPVSAEILPQDAKFKLQSKPEDVEDPSYLKAFGQGALEGGVEAAKALPSSFMKGFYSNVSTALDAYGMATSYLGYPLQGKPYPLGTTLGYKLARDYEKDVQATVPTTREQDESFTGQVAGGVGQSVGIMLGGGAAKAVGVGATVYSATTGAVLSGGSSGRQAFEQGANPDQVAIFAALNAVVGTSEAVPMSGWIDKLNDATGGQFGKGLKAYLLEVGKEGAEEFGQEWFQQFTSNLFEKVGYNPTKDVMEDVLKSAQVGGAAGTISSLVINALGLRLPKRAKGNTSNPIPNAPSTSQAVSEANANLETELAQGLKPLTEMERPEGEDIFKSDEAIDLDSLAPKMEATDAEQTPTSQEDQKSDTSADPKSELTYGEQVLRRVSQPLGQGQEASPYDVDDPEVSAAGAIKPGEELNFNKPGRPATVDTGLEAQKPLAVDQELPVVNEQATEPVTSIPSNKLGQRNLFDDSVGAGKAKLDSKYDRSLAYATEYYVSQLRDAYVTQGLIKSDKQAFSKDLVLPEIADKLISVLQQADLAWPEAEEEQVAFMRQFVDLVEVSWRGSKQYAEVKSNLGGTPAPEPPEIEEALPGSIAEAISSINTRFSRMQQGMPVIKRKPRVNSKGSRVTSELRLTEESSEYLDQIKTLPESPDEDKNLAEAEKYFQKRAKNLKKSRPNMSFDETRLANAARLRYWRTLRKKFDLRKNRTENLGEGEAEEAFQTVDSKKISKDRIFRSVTEDFSRKFGRRLGGNVGMEAAVSLQTALGDDDGSGTLEDTIGSPSKTFDEDAVRIDILKNAKNAYFASLNNDPVKKFLLGAALDEAGKKGGDPKQLAKNSTRLSEIAGILNQGGYKTSTGELAKVLPKLVDDMVTFVKEKRDVDFQKYQKTGELPALVEGPQKVFKVLQGEQKQIKLTEDDRSAQSLARDMLSELEEAGFLTSMEMANIQDKLDFSPRKAAAFRAIQEMQSVLDSKKPGAGISEPILRSLSTGNPEKVANLVSPVTNLLPHQREAANLIINAYKEGRTAALLADDAGLGKGRTFLSAARFIADDKAKARNEPNGKIFVITESNELIDAGNGLKSQLAAANIPRNRLYFFTYDAFSKGQIKGLDSADVIVFDESQNLKNTGTIRTRMSKETSAFKIFSTATPADRANGVLYFLPGILGKSEQAVRTMLDTSKDRETTIANLAESASTVGAYIRRVPEGQRPYSAVVELEAGDVIQKQLQQIENYYLRQIQELVGDGSTILTPDQVKKKQEFEALMRFKLEAWSEINKLQYIVSSALSDLEAGKQVIVFGEFVNSVAFPELGLGEHPSLLETLNELFSKEGIQPAVIYGEGGNQMTSDINDFQSGNKKIALATPTKAGAGLSLDDQTGTAPRVVYIATPNDAADKHDQMLHRAGFRLNSRTIPEIKELVTTDTWTDRARITRRSLKQGTLDATQGVVKEDESGQIGLPFIDSRRVDRNSIEELTVENEPLYEEDVDAGVPRRASTLRNGQLIDERFSRLPYHEQDLVDDFTKALTDLKFKNVKVLFGNRGGDMGAWTEWNNTDFNTVFINPKKLRLNRDIVGRKFSNRLNEAGRGYLIGIASEEMLHNSLFATIRAMATTIHNDRIQNGEITAQEAYVETMEYVLDKASLEIDPAAKEVLRAKYGRGISERKLTIEYLRFVHQKARLGYATEDLGAGQTNEDIQSIKAMLKGAPKDGYVALWFKTLRQALFELLGKLGLTIQQNQVFGGLLDATDNILYQLEKYGPNAPPQNNQIIGNLIRLVSPETQNPISLTKGGLIESDTPSLAEVGRELAKETRRSKSNKQVPQESIIEFGDDRTVRDATKGLHKFRFAWVERSKVQASHLGSSKQFSSNREYTGDNQRNYAYSDEERAKIMRIEGSEYNPETIVNEGSGASNQGLPLIMFDEAVGEWMVVAGNGREQVLGEVFKDENRKQYTLELAAKLATSLNGPVPEDFNSGKWFLYRVLDERVDTKSPESKVRLNRLIVETNAEGGLEMSHLQKAQQDSTRILESPVGKRGLRNLVLNIADMNRDSAQTYLSQLADNKIINRDERNALFVGAAGSSPAEYVQYLALVAYLQPLERHLGLRGPVQNMANEIMDQGVEKNLYLLMAQASAASESMGEEEAAKYKAFFSRIMNQMLSQKARGEQALVAIKDLASRTQDLLDETGAAPSSYKEVEADKDFKALVDFIVAKIGPTSKMTNGRTRYTAKSKTLFNVILDELASSLSENAKQGNAEDMFSLSPIQKAMEAVTTRLRYAEKNDGEEIEANEFSSAGEVTEPNQPQSEMEELRARIRDTKAKLGLEFKKAELEAYAKAKDKARASIQKPVYNLDGEEVVNQEPEYQTDDYNDPFNEMGDQDWYEGMDVNMAEEEASTERYASNFEYIAARTGKAVLTEGAIERHGKNLADLSVFEETPHDDNTASDKGFASREEYNRLLSAIEGAGLGVYYKIKDPLNKLAQDNEWLSSVLEKLKERADLKKFWMGLSGENRLIEPVYRIPEIKDPVIDIVFGPLSKALEVRKTTNSIQSYEDEAIRKLVEAQIATKRTIEFLEAIGYDEKSKNLLDIAKQASAAYDRFMKTSVSVQDITSTDADWNAATGKWEDKKQRLEQAPVPAPLDLELRKKLKEAMQVIDSRAILTAIATPSNVKRVVQFRVALSSANANLAALDKLVAEKKKEIAGQGAWEQIEKTGKLKKMTKALFDLEKARNKAVAEQHEISDLFYRAVDTEHISKIGVKEGEKTKLTEKQVENLSPVLLAEMRRRGMLQRGASDMYEKTIDWTFPANFVGLGNREEKIVSAQVVFQENPGLGMIVKFNSSQNTSGDFRLPVFTNGTSVPNLHSEYAASAFYEKVNGLAITRFQGRDRVSIRTILPVAPDLEYVKRVEAKLEERQKEELTRPVITGMRVVNSALFKTEPARDERGRYMWEFQLTPERVDFTSKSLGTTPSKLYKGKRYGGTQSGTLTNSSSKSRKVYVRAKTADEAVQEAVRRLGEFGDIYYKGKWYGKSMPTKTEKVTEVKKTSETPISFSQAEVRSALYNRRMDLLLQAVERGRASDKGFDFIVRNEAEAYLAYKFENGATLQDPDVVRVAKEFGLWTINKGQVNDYGLRKLQELALSKATPKSMSVVNRGNKQSATGPMRDVSQNFMFQAAKISTIDVAVKETEYVVPEGRQRNSDEVLADIAAKNGVSVDALKAANSLVMGRAVAGSTLLIPGTTKSVEVPNFFEAPESLTALELATRKGITKAEMLSYNNLPADYVPKPGDILKFPGSELVNNLQELAFKIIKNKDHVTFPQMVFKDRAPQGVKLIDRDGGYVGSGVVSFEGDLFAYNGNYNADTLDREGLFNAVSTATPWDVVQAVNEIFSKFRDSGSKKVKVTSDKANQKITVSQDEHGYTYDEVTDWVFGAFEDGKSKRDLSLIAPLCEIDIRTVKDGVLTTVQSTPQSLQSEKQEDFPKVTRNYDYGAETGIPNGTTITIKIPSVISLPGGFKKVPLFYFPNAIDLGALPRGNGQVLEYTEMSPTGKATNLLGKVSKLQSHEAIAKDGQGLTREARSKKEKVFRSFKFYIDSTLIDTTGSTSRIGALSRIAAKMVARGENYRGQVYKKTGLLVYRLKNDLASGAIRLVENRNDSSAGAGSVRSGEEREQTLRGLSEARQKEGRSKTQGFAGQLSSDSRLGEEIKSASTLRDFKYSVRTQPLRAEEMIQLIQRVGGAELAANALLSPDIEVRDDDLRAIKEGTTTHFDNVVVLNTLLIQQLEKAAKENPSKAEELRALQFGIARKQADLGTSLAQGLRAFGGYSRIGVAGWMWFATNAKQVERLRQVGLFASDIQKGKLAGDEAIQNALDRVFSSADVKKLGGLIDQAANNGVWAQLLVKAKYISSTSAEWQRMSTNTLSTVLDQQIKTAKEMIALLKVAEDSQEKDRQLSTTIAEGTAALLQKGTETLGKAASELGVPEEKVLENIEKAQDVLDEESEKTTGEYRNHLWKRFGNTKLLDNQDDTVGVGSAKPGQAVSRASKAILDNVIDGFIKNFEKALNNKDQERVLPQETAIKIIRRILRERIQLKAEGQLILTRSKLSQEQRKLLSLKRFRDAMTSWESLGQAVDIINRQLADSIDEGSYPKIMQAMSEAMDEPFTKSDIRAFMTTPAFNFKDFVFSRRYLLAGKKAEVLSELTKELRVSGIEVNSETLNRVLTKVSEELEMLAQEEFQRSMRRLFGKSENKATKVIKENSSSIVKLALTGNLMDEDIYKFIAKKLKLKNEDWTISKQSAEKIRELAEAIVNDPNGPNSRSAATKTLDILDEVKRDSGVTVLEAFVGQFYTNILQGIKTISVNLLAPLGNTLNLASMLAVRAAKERNFASTKTVYKALPRALNSAFVEVVDLLATGDSAGKTLAPGKTLSSRISGRPLPEIMAEGGVRINANSSFGRWISGLAELWFGWNQKGIWPKIAVSRGVWDKTFQIVRASAKLAGVGTVRAPAFPSKAPVIQVSPTGLGVLISRLFNSLDLGTTTFYTEICAALAAEDAVNDLQNNYQGIAPQANLLLSTDLKNLLQLGRQVAGRGEYLPEGFEGPAIVQELEKEAREERGQRLKPGTLDFRQELYLRVRRNRGVSNSYWNRVWNKGTRAEKVAIDRMVGSITEDAFFLGTVMANTNRPIGVLGKLSKLLEGWSNDHLAAKLVQPFYGIVTSVYQNWLNWVGYGLYEGTRDTVTVHGEGNRTKPSDMKNMQLGNGIVGMSLFIAGIAAIIGRMCDDDKEEKEHFVDFSGRGPTDPGYKQALIDSKKWQADSIKIGNFWFKNPNWSPTYLVFKALGYMSDYSKYEKPSQAASSEVAMQFTLAAFKSFGAGVLDVPFLGGVKTLSDLSNLESATWDRKAVGFLMKTGSSLAFGNLLTEADRKIFPEKTDKFGNVHSLTGLMAMAMGNIPFLRNFNKPMTNVLGEPMLSDGASLPANNWDRAKQVMFNYGDMVLRYRDNPDTLWSELAKQRAWVSLPDRLVRVRGIVLNDEQRDDWVMERARVLRETLRDPAWIKDLPSRGSGDVQNEITRLTGRANKLADVLVLNKYDLWEKSGERKQMIKELGARNVD